MAHFKKKYTFSERKDEADRILAKYPTRAPIICERQGTNVPILEFSPFIDHIGPSHRFAVIDSTECNVDTQF